MDVELAYMAGFFDGEGSVSILRDKNGQVKRRLIVVQVDRRPLDSLQSRFGGRLWQRTVRQQPHHRLAWEWKVGLKEGTEFGRAVLPFLVVKRDEMLAFLEPTGEESFSRKSLIST